MLRTANFVSTKLIISQIQIYLPNLGFQEQNHLALLKDQFLKKMHLERGNTLAISLLNYRLN